MAAEDPKDFLTALVSSQAEPLRRFLLKRVRNPADVPDLAQEVFLRMLRIPDHEVIRSPEAYLFTVAQHVAQQHVLRQSSAPPAVDATTMLTELPDVTNHDPVLQLSADQCLEEIDRALARFSPKVRATFILHRRYGLSLQEISERLGVSFPMAKKYLAKALLQCRQHIERTE